MKTNYQIRFISSLERNFRFFKNIPFIPQLIDEQMKLFTLICFPRTFSQMMTFCKYLKQLDQLELSYHRYGGLQFNLGNHEIGHMHGNGVVDLKLPQPLTKAELGSNQLLAHHTIKSTRWVSFCINKRADINGLIELIKTCCDHLIQPSFNTQKILT